MCSRRRRAQKVRGKAEGSVASPRRAEVALDSRGGSCKRCASMARFLLRVAVELVAERFSRLMVACAVAGTACSLALPVPDDARQPRSEYRPVPYPPPAAFAETVPPAPNKQARWIDGHWAWRGGTYVWQRGGWLVAPAG